MHALIIFALLFACSQVDAQAWVRDSLEILESKISKNTHEEIDLLLAWSRLLGFEGDDKLGIEKANQAIEIAQLIGYKEGEARAEVYKQMSEGRLFGSDVGLPNLQKAIRLARAVNSKNIEVFALYNYAEHFLYEKNNTQRTLEILEEALSKLDGSVHHKNKGNVYKVLGVCLDEMGKNKEGLAAYEKALYHFEQVGENPDIDPLLKRPNADAMDGGLLNQGQILMYLGEACLKAGNPIEAKEYVVRAMDIYQEADIPANVAWGYEYLSNIANYEGDYEAVIKSLQKALLIYQEQGEKSYESGVLKSFGVVYQQLNDPEQARINYEKSIIIDNALQDTLSLLENYMAMSSLKVLEQQADEAMLDINKSLVFAKTINDSLSLSLIYQSMGYIWELKNEPDSAVYYFQKSIPIMERHKNYQYVLTTRLSLAQLLHRDGQQDSALHAMQLIEEQLPQYGALEQYKSTHKLLSSIHAAKGDFEQALQHHQSFFAYHDSLYTENTQQIAKAERTRQNIDGYKIEKEAATLKAQLLSTQNNLYLALAIGLLSLLLVGSYLFWQLRKTKFALEGKNQQLADLNATKDKFFGIIAHDIRSPITALDSVAEQIHYYLKKDDKAKLERLAGYIGNTTSRLSSLLDNLLQWALLQTGMIPNQPTKVDVQTAAQENVELYEEVAALKNIKLHNNVSANTLVFADSRAITTVIRNLVNNAIKFTPKGGEVSIGTEQKGDKVFISINDTGTGIAADKVGQLFTLQKKSKKGTAGEKGTGLGLLLCKDLVEMNRGTIQAISELGKGSSFIFSLPKSIRNL